MDTFFEILKKSLIATIFVVFAFVATYVPQPRINNVETAYASGAIAGAIEPTQLLNFGELTIETITQIAIRAIEAVSRTILGSLEFKEYVLDYLAFTLAKQVVSDMIQSLINWVNSGFEGSPTFVQDVRGYLLDVADNAAGQYIDQLGSAGSFICEPFRLDVATAVQLEYAHVRTNNEPQTCTLNDVVTNMEDFLEGTQESFSQNGGWNQWLEISSKPKMYTSFGTALEAKRSFETNLLNEKGEEISLLNYGSGFLSSKNCNTIRDDYGVETENCEVVSPGKIVQEALSFNLDTGRQTLVAADEFNELIASLIGAVTNHVFERANGILGL